MLAISDAARNHFRRLIEQQDSPGLGIRVQALQAGSPKADCRLEFCEPSDLAGDEWSLDCGGFWLYVDSASMPYLEGAEIDFAINPTGGLLTVRAPKLRGVEPAPDASLEERVRYLLESEINPQIAAHGGRVSLVEITADKAVLLRF